MTLAGAWMIHPILILIVKVLVDAIPGMTQDVSWTIVNLGYMAVSGSPCGKLIRRLRFSCFIMLREYHSSRRECSQERSRDNS